MVLPKSIWKRQLKSYWKTRSASSLWREPQIISGFGSRITGLSTRLKETKFGCCSCEKETKFTETCRKHSASFSARRSVWLFKITRARSEYDAIVFGGWFWNGFV